MKDIVSENNQSGRYDLPILLCLAFIPRFILFMLSRDADGDSAARTMIAVQWADNPHLMLNSIWGPLHFYLMGAALKIWDSRLFAPRLVSLVFGTLSVIPLYHLFKLLFDRKIALISGLMFCLYILHMKNSALSLSGVPFSFFVLCTLYCFFRSIRTEEGNGTGWTVLAGIFMNLSMAIRYEGKLFVGLLGLYLLFRKDFRKLIIFLLIASIYPIYEIAGWWITTGNPFSPYTTQLGNEIQQGISLTRPFQWIWSSLKDATPLMWAFCVTGLGVCVFVKKYRPLALLCLAYWLFLFLFCARGNLNPQSRYTLTPTIMMLPFAAFLLTKLTGQFSRTGAATIYGLFFASIIATGVLMIWQPTVMGHKVLAGRSPIVKPKPSILSLSAWLKDNVRPGEKILLDEAGNDLRPSIILFSGLIPDRAKGPSGDRVWKTVTKQMIWDYLKSQRPQYMVYAPGGMLPDLFNLSGKNKVERAVGYQFQLLKQEPPYIIYRIHYSS